MNILPGIDGILKGVYAWSVAHTSLHGLTTRTFETSTQFEATIDS